MNKKRFITFLNILLILNMSFVTSMSFVIGTEKTIEAITYIYKAGSKQVKILTNTEEKIVELDFPVIIRNNRSLGSIITAPDSRLLPGFTTVDYDVIDKTITISFRDENGNRLIMQVNSNEAYFNGEKIVMDVTPLHITEKGESYTLIPIRYTYEPFGYTVEWNNDTREITVYK